MSYFKTFFYKSLSGLPTLEPQPLRTRSSSFRHTRENNNSATPSPTGSRCSSPLPSAPQSSVSSAKGRSYSVGTGGLAPRTRSPSPLLSLETAPKPRSKSLSPRQSLGVAGQSDDPNASLLSTADSNVPLNSEGEQSDEDISLQDASSSSSFVTLTIPESEQTQDLIQDKDKETPDELAAGPQGSAPAEQCTDSESSKGVRTSTPPVTTTKKRGSVTICEHVTVIEDGHTRLVPTEEYDGQSESCEEDQVLVSLYKLNTQKTQVETPHYQAGTENMDPGSIWTWVHKCERQGK